MTTKSAALDLSKHPCFNEDAKGVCGRVHLPVAPRCNIKCNYCNRKFDCVNESRPGVASAVLSPDQALLYLDKVLEREPSVSVVGIAGPGDPFANPDETLESLRRIRAAYPDMLLCVSSNGLALPRHLDDVAALGVSHVTVTINAVDPAVGEKIYAWARDGKVIYRGRQAAELLLERQLAAVRGLKERGVTVKVNTILIPGVNQDHVEAVARTVAGLGADVLNVMAMIPNPDTPFADLAEPGCAELNAARAAAARHLPQMKHCQRCRADAVGLLEADRSEEFASLLEECASTVSLSTAGRPYVAVASQEGLLVNQHLGEATRFQVWAPAEAGFRLVEERDAPPRGGGVARWRALAALLGDCRAVLVSGVGEGPREILTEAGVAPLEMSGFIDLALQAVFAGGDTGVFRRKRAGGCSKGLGCQGDGAGCG